MALILSFETSTKVCSVALHKDGQLLSSSEVLVEKSHSKNITLLTEGVLNHTGFSFKDLDAIAVSKGPGSYTGLRIGVSTAKGYCYALDKPLIAINTLHAMAQALKAYVKDEALLCPMLDARRMEIYTALFDQQLNYIEETKALVVDESSFQKELSLNKIYFFGDGSNKCKDLLKNSNALFIDGVYPHAKSIGLLAELAFQNKNFEDTIYFEPYYLKDFVSTGLS